MQQSKIERVSAEFGPMIENVNSAVSETDDAKRRDKLKGATAEADRIAAQYPTMYAGRSAQLAIGNAHYYLAAGLPNPDAATELKTALTAYEKYLSQAVTAEEKAGGQLALGNTYENLWYLDPKDANLGLNATKAYQAVDSLFPGSYLAAEAKLAQARLLEVQEGHQRDALTKYNELMLDRKVDLGDYAKEKAVKDSKGREITPEEIAKLKSNQPSSYESVAQKSASRLNALAPAK
jgi:hypothetical protein